MVHTFAPLILALLGGKIFLKMVGTREDVSLLVWRIAKPYFSLFRDNAEALNQEGFHNE